MKNSSMKKESNLLWSDNNKKLKNLKRKRQLIKLKDKPKMKRKWLRRIKLLTWRARGLCLDPLLQEWWLKEQKRNFKVQSLKCSNISA
jgi:hypothetical protein